jgi:hypothetical protein
LLKIKLKRETNAATRLEGKAEFLVFSFPGFGVD